MLRIPLGFRCMLITLLLVTCAPSAAAEEGRKPRATFAMIIGSNASVDQDLAPLRYADDDAARYFDLFRLLGARAVLLSRLDDNTKRLHPQAAAEALLPRRADLTQATITLAAEVKRARERGLEPIVYFLFAGHGGTKNGQGYIALEDARLTGHDLALEIVSKIDGAETHLIVDACSSFLLAYARGPGGERSPASGFGEQVYELARDPRVGLLLSTSSGKESHEWDAFESGVFSHEVRSGLYGAADADGDGIITYTEMAAFVQRANQPVKNERFRPQVHARAPKASAALADVRSTRGRTLRIDGAHTGRYFLEDAQGVRLADFNTSPGQAVSLLRPPARAYLHRMDDERELLLPPGDGVLEVASLAIELPRTRTRGAAHDAFDLLFSLPFGQKTVDAYRPPAVAVERDNGPSAPRKGVDPKLVLGVSALVVGGGGLGLGAFFSMKANAEEEPSAGESQVDRAERNERVGGWNTRAGWSYAGGGVVAATGLVLLLWPKATPVRVSTSRGGGMVEYEAAF